MCAVRINAITLAPHIHPTPPGTTFAQHVERNGLVRIHALHAVVR